MTTHFENPGVPTNEERGTYCPHGEKIEEWSGVYPHSDESTVRTVVKPWPCHRCTEKTFLEAKAEMEAELATSEG